MCKTSISPVLKLRQTGASIVLKDRQTVGQKTYRTVKDRQGGSLLTVGHPVKEVWNIFIGQKT